MLDTYIKNRGMTKTIIHSNNHNTINETNWDLPGGTLLRQVFERITTAIREVDKNHIIYTEVKAI